MPSPYYADNDVGATGGTGTQEDPYGIETAIAAATAGDVFYWRGGGEGDVGAGHTLEFNNGGDATAPVWWIGTDDDWIPIVAGQTPHTGVSGESGNYPVVQISASNQIFENIGIHDSQGGSGGGVIGCEITTSQILLRNCVAWNVGYGFKASTRAIFFEQCRSYDAWFGFYLAGLGNSCCACTVNDVESDAFYITNRFCSLDACQVYGVGGAAAHFHHDTTVVGGLRVTHLSAYDCGGDGVWVDAFNGTNPNSFTVSSSIFDTIGGYAVNVTTPAGQMGMILNNASRSCTSGQVPAGRTGLINDGWQALSASPFVDAAGGDLSLIRSTPCIGNALDGGDIGALQRAPGRIIQPVTGA